MSRHSRTSHRLSANRYGFRADQLVAEYRLAHPNRIATRGRAERRQPRTADAGLAIVLPQTAAVA